jgi:hypothetical protein
VEAEAQEEALMRCIATTAIRRAADQKVVIAVCPGAGSSDAMVCVKQHPSLHGKPIIRGGCRRLNLVNLLSPKEEKNAVSMTAHQDGYIDIEGLSEPVSL